ncbi:hypothetical protein KQI65_04105 [bacterium]|nr:hypothetical protein [bacterium]
MQTRLRAVFADLDTSLLAACMEAFALEAAAIEKCGFASGCLVTREGLEMASSAATARLHASLLPSQGVLLDIASGIGSDALALTQRADGLLCIEADEAHVRLLRHNLSVSGCRNALALQGLAEHWLPHLRTEKISGVFADPARRDTGRRFRDIEEYQPSLDLFDALPSATPVVVKIAPGADAPPGWQVATVATGSACPEQLLTRNCGLPSRCALHADNGERWIPGDAPSRNIGDPTFLIEPHAAIIRTGSVAHYLREQRAEALDPQIAYGWSEERPLPSIWHRSFHLLRVEAFNRKRLRRIATELDFGPTTEIKKRGFPETPEQLRRQLSLRGSRNGVIIVTRRGDEHLMMFAERID